VLCVGDGGRAGDDKWRHLMVVQLLSFDDGDPAVIRWVAGLGFGFSGGEATFSDSGAGFPGSERW